MFTPHACFVCHMAGMSGEACGATWPRLWPSSTWLLPGSKGGRGRQVPLPSDNQMLAQRTASFFLLLFLGGARNANQPSRLPFFERMLTCAQFWWLVIPQVRDLGWHVAHFHRAQLCTLRMGACQRLVGFFSSRGHSQRVLCSCIAISCEEK